MNMEEKYIASCRYIKVVWKKNGEKSPTKIKFKGTIVNIYLTRNTNKQKLKTTNKKPVTAFRIHDYSFTGLFSHYTITKIRDHIKIFVSRKFIWSTVHFINVII